MRRLALFFVTSLLAVGLVHCVGDAPAGDTSTGNGDGSAGDANASDGGNGNDGSSTDGGGTTDGQAGDAGFVDSCIGFLDCPKNVQSVSLQLWLRGGIGETCSGGRLMSWADQAGTGRDATPAHRLDTDAGVLPPQCGVATIGTNPVVTFTAPAETDAGKGTEFVDETLGVDLGFLDSTAYTIVIVHERASDAPFTLISTDNSFTTGGHGLACLENGSDPEAQLNFGYLELSPISNGIFFSEGCDNGEYDTDTYIGSTPEAIELVFSESAGHKIFVNGVPQFTGDTMGDDLSPLGIVGQGAIGRGSNAYLNDFRYKGNIGEVIVWSTALDMTDLGKINQHLQRQWGIEF